MKRIVRELDEIRRLEIERKKLEIEQLRLEIQKLTKPKGRTLDKKTCRTL